jgi:hypothetical protein
MMAVRLGRWANSYHARSDRALCATLIFGLIVVPIPERVADQMRLAAHVRHELGTGFRKSPPWQLHHTRPPLRPASRLPCRVRALGAVQTWGGEMYGREEDEK